MIRLTETNNEYLLAIPAAQRERAKGIQGRRWNPQLRRWVYPRTNRTYDALVAEFGDDLTQESDFTHPSSDREQEDRERQATADLLEKVEGISQTMSKLLRFLSHTDNERTETLMLQEEEIRFLKGQLIERDEETYALQDRYDQLEKKYGRLIKETTEQPYSDRDEVVMAMAMEVMGHDRVFGEQLKKMRIDGTLPLKVAGLMEGHLKNLLRSEGPLNELLRELDDIYVLDRYAVDIAHMLRKQRNKVAHLGEPEDPRIEMGRALFCLFGAALLFPELPEVDAESDRGEGLGGRGPRAEARQGIPYWTGENE